MVEGRGSRVESQRLPNAELLHSTVDSRLSTWLQEFSLHVLEFQNGAPGQRVNVNDVVSGIGAVAGRIFINIRRTVVVEQKYPGRGVNRGRDAALRERNVFVAAREVLPVESQLTKIIERDVRKNRQIVGRSGCGCRVCFRGKRKGVRRKSINRDGRTVV